MFMMFKDDVKQTIYEDGQKTRMAKNNQKDTIDLKPRLQRNMKNRFQTCLTSSVPDGRVVEPVSCEGLIDCILLLTLDLKCQL